MTYSRPFGGVFHAHDHSCNDRRPVHWQAASIKAATTHCETECLAFRLFIAHPVGARRCISRNMTSGAARRSLAGTLRRGREHPNGICRKTHCVLDAGLSERSFRRHLSITSDLIAAIWRYSGIRKTGRARVHGTTTWSSKGWNACEIRVMQRSPICGSTVGPRSH